MVCGGIIQTLFGNLDNINISILLFDLELLFLIYKLKIIINNFINLDKIYVYFYFFIIIIYKKNGSYS